MDPNTLSPGLLAAIVFGYFALLIGISWFTSGNADNATFFRAGNSSPWYLVAWGMIGASLSGVTFVSIPGVVGAGGLNQQLSYMQVVLGYLLGYGVIAGMLLPLYYRLGLTSIYGYLEQRFGTASYRTGAAFFQLSRIVGASFRLYLVAMVLDSFVLGPLGFPFAATVAITLLLIYLYTFRGGIQTVVYTDTLQTAAMLIAVGIAITYLSHALGKGVGDVPRLVAESGLAKTFFFGGGWSDANNFFKQFFSGALITIVMTGLDQDMMQKNLTCRSLGDARKNMYTFAAVLVPINLLFLCLGILLYMYLGQEGIAVPEQADQVFPSVALRYLPPVAGIAFVIGLIAAAYSSADSALTALTTSFCVDFLGFEAGRGGNDDEQRRTRAKVHVGFTVVLFGMIMLFYAVSDKSVINALFKVAGYTYGPLLGLFAYGLFTRRLVLDAWVPLVAVASVALTYLIDSNSAAWFGGLELGFLNLALNGLLTFLGLLLINRRPVTREV